MSLFSELIKTIGILFKTLIIGISRNPYIENRKCLKLLIIGFVLTKAMALFSP